MSNETNVGFIDRLVRIAFGIGLLMLFVESPVPSITLLGIVPLLSGLLGFCPVYYYAGASTARSAPQRSTGRSNARATARATA